jgi:hypothetical protein
MAMRTRVRSGVGAVRVLGGCVRLVRAQAAGTKGMLGVLGVLGVVVFVVEFWGQGAARARGSRVAARKRWRCIVYAEWGFEKVGVVW